MNDHFAVLEAGMQPIQEIVDVLIIGAGLCGVTAARSLTTGENKQSWKLIDKSRSVGGRMATRRIEEARFDHGAQFFTVRSEAFKAEVDNWLKQGACKEWVRGFGDSLDDGHPRYVGTNGMNQVVKEFAAPLPQKNIALNEKIIDVELIDGFIASTSESGTKFFSKKLVLTSPLTQTTAMMAKFTLDQKLANILAQLSGIVYDPCIALMGFFDPEELPLDKFPAKSMNAPLAFVADNFSKGLSGKKASLTVHLSSEASHGLFTANDSVVVDFVCHELRRHFHLKKVTRPTTVEVHRWRFATPKTTIQEPYLSWSGPNGLAIYFAGEAFGGPKIEGAYLSGLAVGKALAAEG
jgi:predicted NAD/FAD-dependent oxidoreductase